LFYFNASPPPDRLTLSLHDALPIYLSVGYALGVTSLDTVTVTGATLAAIDTTSAQVGTTLNLNVVESLPTGRSYQSYLQLVPGRSEEHTSELQSRENLVCRLLLEKK